MPINLNSIKCIPRLPREWVIVAALALAGLLIRGIFFNYYAFEGSDCDGASYIKLADNISTGNGWQSNKLQMLFLLPDNLPYPESHWSPLFPLILASFFRLFGSGYAVAKLVPLLFGVLIIPATYWLTRELTGSRVAAFIAGILALTHQSLISYSLRMLTESGTIFLVALTFILCISARTRHRPYLAGLALGLAYLMKYQSILLWPAVALLNFLNHPWRAAVRRLVVAAAVFVVTISPWLIRNTMEFGDPFYTDLKYNVLAFQSEFGGQHRYFGSLEVPPSIGEFFIAHPRSVIRHAMIGARTLQREFFKRNVSLPFFLPLALLGLPTAWRRKRLWLPVLLYAALLIGVVSISLPIGRYMLSIMPPWMALAGAGGCTLWKFNSTRHPIRILARIAVIVLVTGAATSQVRGAISEVKCNRAVWHPICNYCALEAAAVSDYIRIHTNADEPILCAEVFHYSLILNRNCIAVPFDEDALIAVSRRYNARYLVISARDLARCLPGWVENVPPWVHLVHSVPAKRIPRPARNPDYLYVSDLFIYRLEFQY